MREQHREYDGEGVREQYRECEGVREQYRECEGVREQHGERCVCDSEGVRVREQGRKQELSVGVRG